MKKYIIPLCIPILVIILYFSYTLHTSKKDIIEIGNDYIINLGYEVVSSSSQPSSHILRQKDICHLPWMGIWGVQRIKPDKYFDKKLLIYSYIVKKHPLDSYGDKNQTNLWLIVNNNRIIGGYSFPNNTEPLYGGVFSLTGKTIKQVKGYNYQIWREKWFEKYK
ncbi:hypothetical protein PV797_02310 [Clostridiaceae bacterium M8S5]|nr:hypothetical protein PV797_02310 [Clostridiaceae bacterium M8S5]